MAITYKKPQAYASVVTVGGTTVTATGDIASAAIKDYKERNTMEILDTTDNSTVIIPFHAVQYFGFAYLDAQDVTKGDPYCDEEGGGEEGGDEVESQKVYISSGSVIDTERSDLKTANEIYEFISANYEIIPDERTDTQYKCSLKSGGTPIQFYLNEQECETNNLSLDMSSGTTMETARINFNTTTSAEYGVKVAMNNSIRIYDDRED